ncbi:MAG: response regulator transcription factor [Clostridia bacterium]|nr:response regulator transcription factor [Clostridia bacterium]
MTDKLSYMRIAVCDIREDVLIQMEEILEHLGSENNIQVSVETMESGNTLFQKIRRRESYDIICLSMENEDIDSVKLAATLREEDEETVFFFISRSSSRIKEIFDVMPAAYLEYPLQEDEVTHWFKKMVRRFRDERRYFSFNFERRTYHIPYQDITYLESCKHHIEVKTPKGWYRFYGRMDEVEQRLENADKMFFRIHKSYMVNYRYISWFDGNSVKLMDGELLPVSATYRDHARSQYWRCGEKTQERVHGSA